MNNRELLGKMLLEEKYPINKIIGTLSLMLDYILPTMDKPNIKIEYVTDWLKMECHPVDQYFYNNIILNKFTNGESISE